jgi:hypothetical protein
VSLTTPGACTSPLESIHARFVCMCVKCTEFLLRTRALALSLSRSLSFSLALFLS